MGALGYGCRLSLIFWMKNTKNFLNSKNKIKGMQNLKFLCMSMFHLCNDICKLMIFFHSYLSFSIQCVYIFCCYNLRNALHILIDAVLLSDNQCLQLRIQPIAAIILAPLLFIHPQAETFGSITLCNQTHHHLVKYYTGRSTHIYNIISLLLIPWF